MRTSIELLAQPKSMRSIIAAILTRTEPHGKRPGLSAVKQTRYLGLRRLRGNPRKMCPSVELLRQLFRMNNFNHQKRLGKGQLLGRLVLLVASILTFPVFANAQEIFSKEDAFALCKQKSSNEI